MGSCDKEQVADLKTPPAAMPAPVARNPIDHSPKTATALMAEEMDMRARIERAKKSKKLFQEFAMSLEGSVPADFVEGQPAFEETF